jgi:hypothetical protein
LVGGIKALSDVTFRNDTPIYEMRGNHRLNPKSSTALS